ncbi:MAG TPA: hypothetical protein VMX74_12910 [Pirellulales bacterium]|nr:hypothetical protein [Pirellulales bacterium]
MTAASVADLGVKFRICRNRRTIRRALHKIRKNEDLADVFLFGRRTTARNLDFVERRAADREPVQLPIYVTSVSFDGKQVEVPPDSQAEILAITKDVSLRGIGFTHDEPFEGEFAIVTFDMIDATPVSLLLDVRWSNLEWGYAYMSGGRFLGIVEVLEK